MDDWILPGLILAFFIWLAKDNPIGWFYVGFFLLLIGAIALPPPWAELCKYILYVGIGIATVGIFFSGGGTGGNDRGGFHDDSGG